MQVSLLEQGQQDGSIESSLDSEAAASLILSIAYGLRVAGKVSDVAHEEKTLALALKILG